MDHRRRGPVPARAAPWVALGLLLLFGCRIETIVPEGGAGDEEPDIQLQVERMLELQAEAWNAGDLDGFMLHYERAPTTTYIGAAGLLIGYDAIRARYAPLFEPGAARDSLRFTDLRTRPLDQRYGLATARYVLHRGGETTSTGPFTLVLMSVEGAWRIVHDQSAADPP